MKSEVTKIKVLYDAVCKILKFAEGIENVDELTSSIMVWDAIKMNLVVIYETYLKLSEKEKNKYDTVPWYEIETHKPKLENQYLGFDSEEIWRVIHDRLPEFKEQLKKVIEN